jgi:hypothetical protein
LRELLLVMDSAVLSQSRKLLEGCAAPTSTAFVEAVSTIPAKAFAGMHDVRYEPNAGFASTAIPILAASPAIRLAAMAALRCSNDGDRAVLLNAIVDNGAPSRGPRNAALAALLTAKISYDKAGAKLRFPRSKPFGSSYPEGAANPRSAGGIVKSVKRTGDTITVELQPMLVRTEDCVRSHDGKLARIHGNGRLEYESICDKTEKRTHDANWDPIQLAAKYAPLLKPGVLFSSMGSDVIAVWPSASAKVPSIVLGAAVK